MGSNNGHDDESRTDGKRAASGLGTTLLTAIAALVGTAVGNGLRLFIKNRSENADRESHGLSADEPMQLTFTGVVSNTVAATAIAHAVDRNRPLTAFMIGAGLTAATGDTPDRMIMDLFKGVPDGFVPMDIDDEPDGV